MNTLKKEWNTWFVYFLIFCMIGWIYEVLVFNFELGYGFVNRGFLFGPYLPVYGFGGILIVGSMRKLAKQDIRIGGFKVTPVICFLAIVLLATAVELLTSYLMELAIGEWLWDYTKDGPNFQGRIALKSSLRFGIIGLLGLYGIQPLLEKVTGFFRKRQPLVYRAATYLVFGLFMADVAARLFLGSNYVGP